MQPSAPTRSRLRQARHMYTLTFVKKTWSGKIRAAGGSVLAIYILYDIVYGILYILYRIWYMSMVILEPKTGTLIMRTYAIHRQYELRNATRAKSSPICRKPNFLVEILSWQDFTTDSHQVLRYG